MTGYITQLWTLLDILLSAVLGFAIGLERKMRFKEAGIRTHTIVCIGSALIMVVSKLAFGGVEDSTRIAAQIVSGIGFLGAGIIIYRKHELRGLTTAAGVWATAGIGMACGGKLYIVAAGATVILIGVQCLTHLRVPPFRVKQHYSLIIRFEHVTDECDRVKSLFGVDRFNHLVMERGDGKILYSAKLITNKEFPSSTLTMFMAENKFIKSIERGDDE